MKTFEDVLIASMHIEIETGTLRSVGALYALALPFIVAEGFPCSKSYIDIHDAVRKKWPGKREGLVALDKVKTIGWANHDKLAKLQKEQTSPTRDICQYCKNEIDWEYCCCGYRADTHTVGSGHSPVPMGCTCGYETSPERANEQEPK